MGLNPLFVALSVAIGLLFGSLVGVIASITYHPTARLTHDRLEADASADTRLASLHPVAVLGKVRIPEDVVHALGYASAERRLIAAGYHPRLDATTYIRFKVVVELLIGLLFLLLALSSLIIPVGALVVFLIVGILFWLLSDWYLEQKRQARIDKINRATPDLADLLSVSVDGGLDLNRAFRGVVARFPDPLGIELRKALRSWNHGSTLKQALERVVTDTGSEELGRFVRSFLQASEQGGRIAENLRNLSEDMRERRKQRAQERGRRAATQVLAPMMLCIFPALLIVVVGPALMSFLSSFSGR